MAQIVLGVGTSHTPMLNAPVGDRARFIVIRALGAGDELCFADWS
jgi:hypothetical protein